MQYNHIYPKLKVFLRNEDFDVQEAVVTAAAIYLELSEQLSDLLVPDLLEVAEHSGAEEDFGVTNPEYENFTFKSDQLLFSISGF